MIPCATCTCVFAYNALPKLYRVQLGMQAAGEQLGMQAAVFSPSSVIVGRIGSPREMVVTSYTCQQEW